MRAEIEQQKQIRYAANIAEFICYFIIFSTTNILYISKIICKQKILTRDTILSINYEYVFKKLENLKYLKLLHLAKAFR